MSQDDTGIYDNHHRQYVGQFLKDHITPGSNLSVVSAYFTIYAFEKLKDQLLEIESLRFLFGEPRFIRSLDPSKTGPQSFKIENDSLELKQHLQQRQVAKDCADWIKKKVDIRSVKTSNLLHGKMYHIENNGLESAMMGSSNFTVRGLGLGRNQNNIELNLEVDSNQLGKFRRD